MTSIKSPPIARISTEILTHLSCGNCLGWWSVSGFRPPIRGTVCCPHCGHENQLPKPTDKPVLPPQATLWIARGYEDGICRYYPEYAGRSIQYVSAKIMQAARDEGFYGYIGDRLAALGWEIVEVEFRAILDP
jgi:hypothetical protein